MEINVLEAYGLITDPNPLSSVKPGALASATNCSYDRLNIYEKTRGFKPCATLSGLVKKFLTYQSKTLAYYLKNTTTQTLAHDTGDCNFVDYGTVENSYPMFSTSANSNFYFTSDDGVKKLDSVTGSILFAGVPRALGGTYTLIDTTGNIIQTAMAMWYRVVWGYTDLNNNLILGAPSPIIAILNQSGVTKDVELNFQIPDKITDTKFFYQIYRSLEVVDTTFPLDELYLVDQVNLTDANITDGFIVYTDHKVVENLGATIYTAPSQQGIQNSYFQPPQCKDIGTFEGVNFYANTKTNQTTLITLQKVQADGFGYFSITGDTTTGSLIVTNVSDTASVQIGQSITSADLPSGTTVLGKTLTTITISQAALNTVVTSAITIRDFLLIGSEYYYASDANDPANRYWDVNTDIETATINLTNLINDISVAYNAYSLGIGEIDKGLFQIESMNFTDPVFTVNASQPSSFIPNLPVDSTNEEFKNRIYLSLPGKPESVPPGNAFDVGTQEYGIQRILFLRDSWFVFKEDGSIYRGVGSTLGDVSLRKFDENAKLRGIQLPAILNNEIYCFTDQGVLAISENGLQVISYSIERELFALSKTRNTSFEDVSFGIGYESDRKYIMFVTTNPDDEVATQAFVFNTLTRGWTRWERDVSFGYWNIAEDRLYIATDIIKRERKDYQNTDFAESEVDVTITDVSGNLITLSSVTGVQVGWTLYQDETKSVIESINGNILTLTKSLTFIEGPAKVYEPVNFSFTYVPNSYGSLTQSKAHYEIVHFVENVDFESFSQTISNEDQGTPETDSMVPKSSALPLQYIRTFLPKNNTRSTWLNITISQNEACTAFIYLGYTLIGDIISERSK